MPLLEHRARRIRVVLAALEDRATLRSRSGQVPRPLHDAIRGFRAELSSLEKRAPAGRPDRAGRR